MSQINVRNRSFLYSLMLWVMAARIRTLGAAIAPVMLGSAMAYEQGHLSWLAVLAAFFSAIFIQIGTNYANDYFDYIKGADTEDRLGPTRVTQAGLIAPKQVFMAFIMMFFLAGVSGLYLVYLGGWPILLLGVLSILSGILYTGGPFALAYLGLGDIFVLIFFGLVATGGSYYVQTHEINGSVLLAGLGVGLLATAILAVNNLRDRLTDTSSGKKTLAVRFGARACQFEYLLCWMGAAAIPILIYLFLPEKHVLSLWASACILPAIPTIKQVLSLDADPALNPILGKTGAYLFVYSLLFSLGWVLA